MKIMAWLCQSNFHIPSGSNREGPQCTPFSLPQAHITLRSPLPPKYPTALRMKANMGKAYHQFQAPLLMIISTHSHHHLFPFSLIVKST